MSDIPLSQTTPLTILIYPARHRTHIGVDQRENRDLTDVEDLPSRSSDDEFKTRFAVVLDKLEQLPAIMTITQLLSNSPSHSTPALSETSLEEKASIRESASFRPVSIDALRLIELTQRASAVMMSAEADYLLQTDPVVSVFRTFGALNRVPVRASISVVNYDEFSNSVARHVDESSSQMLLVPWKAAANEDASGYTGFNPFDNLFKTTVTTEHSTEVVNSHYIRKVFAGSKADVCLIIDRGLSASGSPSDQHIFLPFFGGPDDRLALSLVIQLCARGSGVTATVVRIRKTTGTETIDATEDFKAGVHNVRVSHLWRIRILNAVTFSRPYSPIPFTATSLPRPASRPIPPTTLLGVDTPPPKSQIRPFAKLSAGSRSGKSTSIGPFTSSETSPPPFDHDQGRCAQGVCSSLLEGRGGWRPTVILQS